MFRKYLDLTVVIMKEDTIKGEDSAAHTRVFYSWVGLKHNKGASKMDTNRDKYIFIGVVGKLTLIEDAPKEEEMGNYQETVYQKEE